MWQRFTERARRVIFHAQEEAGKLGEHFISTEHILLGLIQDRDCAGSIVLYRMCVRLDTVREIVEAQAARGDGQLGADTRLTPRGKRVIDLAYDEARRLDSENIGSGHILLGLIREGEGLASMVLTDLRVDLETARREVSKLQSEGRAEDAGDNMPVPPDHPVSKARAAMATTNVATETHKPTVAGPYHTEVEAATRLASLLGHPTVTPVHLAVVLFSDPSATVIRLLGDYGVDALSLLVQFPEADATTPAARPTKPAISYEAGHVLVRAIEKAWGVFHDSSAGREYLLLALLEEPSSVGPVLRNAGLEPYTVLQDLLRLRGALL